MMAVGAATAAEHADLRVTTQKVAILRTKLNRIVIVEFGRLVELA